MEDRPAAAGSFLTDFQGNTKRLADQVGFQYRWDEKTQQWAHAAAIMVLTPDGRISRYLYGVRFKDRDLRLGIDRGVGRQARHVLATSCCCSVFITTRRQRAMSRLRATS